MSEFFGRLETELRAAAERPPRRTVPVPAIAAAVLLAVAVAPIVFVLGSGNDEAGAPGERSAAEKPRPLGIEGFPGAEVVATGTSAVAGPWEIFTYQSERLADPGTGEVHQPEGLRCLGLRLPYPPPDHSGGISAHCGEFASTPGFTRIQQAVPDVAGGAREILVYGRAPEDAALVRLTPDAGEAIEMKPLEGPAGETGDFYLFAVRADIGEGRVNWIDDEGEEGSVGQELLPP